MRTLKTSCQVRGVTSKSTQREQEGVVAGEGRVASRSAGAIVRFTSADGKVLWLCLLIFQRTVFLEKAAVPTLTTT